MASQGVTQQQNVEPEISDEGEEVIEHEEEIGNLQFVAILKVIKRLTTENNNI